jgi:hypothetical protein
MTATVPNPISNQFKDLRLAGMRQAYEEQRISSTYNEMSFDDRLTFLLQREVTDRDNKALQSRLGKAKFKATGALEEMQTSASRRLDKTLLLQLSQCGWVKDKRNILITGPHYQPLSSSSIALRIYSRVSGTETDKRGKA